MSELIIAKVCVALLLLSTLVGAILGAVFSDGWNPFLGALSGALSGFFTTAFLLIVTLAFWFGVQFVFGVGT